MAELAPRGRVGLVLADRAGQADGIRDYTRRLLAALRSAAVDTDLLLWAQGAPRASDRAGVCAADLDALVVQYNPFSFGRWGFAPRLPLFLARLRRKRRRPRIAVMFHETYVDLRSPSWAMMGGWQRAQLIAVQAAADVQLCSIQRWTERLGRTACGRPVHHLPVASNLPDARAERRAERERLGAGADTLVLSCLGLRHPGRLQEQVLRAARAAGKTAGSVLLLDLGPGERCEAALARNVTLRRPGFLDEHDLARQFAASDIFLASLMDGVSTRRGSVMAALQHALPVVGTAGHLTDDVLKRAPGLLLVGVDESDRLARIVTDLGRDAARRGELGHAARELYEREFDWPVLVSRLRTYLDV
jgi:glycosyltransferase involved in cell wall biosynthesis